MVLGGSLAPVCWEATPESGVALSRPVRRVVLGPGAARSGACSLLPGKDLRVCCCFVTLPAGTESHVSPQAAAKLQETERTLRDQEGALKALTLERDQAVQALRTRGLLPEKEVQVSAPAVLPERPQEHSSLLEPSLGGGRGRTGPHRPPTGGRSSQPYSFPVSVGATRPILAPERAEVTLCSDTAVNL